MRKLRLISKFMPSQTEREIITIHILTNVSWSKRNLTMKLSQPKEYGMRNIFLEKSSTKCGWETSPQTLFY